MPQQDAKKDARIALYSLDRWVLNSPGPPSGTP